MLRTAAASVAMLASMHAAAGQTTPEFTITPGASLSGRAAPPAFADAALDLNAAHTSDTAEDITVYAKRRALQQNATLQPAPVTLGRVTATGEQIHAGSFSGLRVTGAIPVGGIPGLDAVASLAAGHDQVNTTTTTSAATALLGLRLKF